MHHRPYSLEGDRGVTVSIFIVTWNPEKWRLEDEEYDLAVSTTARGGVYPEPWTTGSRKTGIRPGDTVFLLRQASEVGLVARGEFASEVFQSEHWEDPTKRANRAHINWTTWLPLEDRLHTKDLVEKVPGVSWNYMLGSGVKVAREVEDLLEEVWAEHLESRGINLEC